MAPLQSCECYFCKPENRPDNEICENCKAYSCGLMCMNCSDYIYQGAHGPAVLYDKHGNNKMMVWTDESESSDVFASWERMHPSIKVEHYADSQVLWESPSYIALMNTYF